MNLRFLPAAVEESRQNVNFLQDCEAGLGHKFLDVLGEAIEQARTRPLQSPRFEVALALNINRDVRRIVLHPFRYLLVYEVRSNEVLVISVTHASRGVGYWHDRLNG